MISGGCLEAELLQSAWALTENGAALVKYDATAEADIIWGSGLGCAGVVQVLLERVKAPEPCLALIQRCQRARERTIVATVISEGPSLGSRCVLGGGGFAGDPCLKPCAEGSIREESRIVETDAGRVFLEVLDPPLNLLIFGAGQDAMPLAKVAHLIGWHVSVIDCREQFVTKDRFPTADRLAVTSPKLATDLVTLDVSTYAVVMTHNYLQDKDLLRQLLSSKVAYIGMLGPRARTERLLDDLDDKWSRDNVFGPVGLDIGAEGPDEIAFAIVAEIQAVRAHRAGGFSSSRSSREDSKRSRVV